MSQAPKELSIYFQLPYAELTVTILHDNITLAEIMTSFHVPLRLSNGPRSTTTIINTYQESQSRRSRQRMDMFESCFKSRVQFNGQHTPLVQRSCPGSAITTPKSKDLPSFSCQSPLFGGYLSFFLFVVLFSEHVAEAGQYRSLSCPSYEEGTSSHVNPALEAPSTVT